jgi:hypothetical protein
MPVSQVTQILHNGVTYTVQFQAHRQNEDVLLASNPSLILLHDILIFTTTESLRWYNVPEKLLIETKKHFKGAEMVMEVTHKMLFSDTGD